MAKTDTVRKNKAKKILTLLLTLAAVAAVVLLVRKFITEKEVGEERRREQNAAEQAANEAKEVQQRYGKPVATDGDTDTVRRYGYDVLYAKNGLRILLKESEIYVTEPTLTFEYVNESDQLFMTDIGYCVVNGLTFHPYLHTEIQPGETVTDSMVLNSRKFSEIKVSNIRLCFSVRTDDYEVNESSAPISISYDSAPRSSWTAPSDTRPVYDSGTLLLTSTEASSRETDKAFYVSSDIYFENRSSSDIILYLTDWKLFDRNGREINEDSCYASFYNVSPGYSLSYSTLKVNINDKSIFLEDIGEILISAVLEPRDGSGDRETISFRVDLSN